MGFIVKWPSRMQGQIFFRSWAGRAAVFGRVQKNLGQGKKIMGGLPPPGFDTPP